MKKSGIALVSLGLLSACISHADMQGVDPKDHYREKPVANKVERKVESHPVQFARGSNRLAKSDIEAITSALRSISPMAVEMVQLQVHPGQQKNHARIEHITKLLRRMGYTHASVLVEPTQSVARDEMRLDVTYASVVSPRCPDWRTSPVTTYSNTARANWSCAYTTNMGLMVADPGDLERGRGRTSLDTKRNVDVIDKYRSGGGDSEGGESSPATASSGNQTQATGP